MKFIEFAVKVGENATILLVDVAEILDILQFNENYSTIHLKSGVEYMVYGSYKCITNRFFYVLSKKNNIYEDDIIRPSVAILHKLEKIQTDNSFLEPIQIYAFLKALNIEKKDLPYDLLEEIKEFYF